MAASSAKRAISAAAAATGQSTCAVLAAPAVSARYAAILTAWRYPKFDRAFADTSLTPHMRGTSYTYASSGGRTLIALAWMLAIFETARETGSAHPGFLMIDSPQKNLGQGGHRDAEFADTVAVADFYKHLHS